MLDYEKLKKSFEDLDIELTLEIIEEVMKNNGSEASKALAACNEGLNVVGLRFEQGEYFIADLICAGELMTQALEKFKPALTADTRTVKGKMILCTVQYDLHDIGKDIVKFLLKGTGFEVIDLGIDVPPETIVKAVKENDAKIVGLSGLLTVATESMKATVNALEAAGTRQNVKIIIGGACASEESFKYIKADAWAQNAVGGVKICSDWALNIT